MSDLISRSSVINLLRELKIDNVAVNGKRITDYIKEQPIAYDVEKVVAEIRRCSGNGYRDVDGDYVPPMIRTKDVIEIVKGGDVDD